MKTKKIKDYPIYEKNPFIHTLKVKKGNRVVAVSPPRHMIDEEGEILESTARMSITKQIDKTHFGKVFFDNIPFHLLEPNAAILLLYLLKKSDYNNTLVHFDPNEWLDEDKLDMPKCSIKTIYKSIKNLLDINLIAKKGNSFYFINPSIGFKGNRLELLK